MSVLLEPNNVAVYQNGNYKVYINIETGLKIRVLDAGETEFLPVFPESCDLTISNRCDEGCAYCYAGCSPDGTDAPIPNLMFQPYTEVALNLNSYYLERPDAKRWLEDFLRIQSSRKVIVNVTVNQREAIRRADWLKEKQMQGWIKGIGISYVKRDVALPLLLNDYHSRILHVIAGVFSKEDHEYLQSFDKPPKLLILGYKHKHRGKSYLAKNLTSYVKNVSWLTDNIKEVTASYPVVAFDNKALEDLRIDEVLDPKDYNNHYMGDEGQFTFAIDLVRKAYSVSSQDPESKYKPMGNLNPTQMFQEIRGRA